MVTQKKEAELTNLHLVRHRRHSISPHFVIKKTLVPNSQIILVGVDMNNLIHGICFKHADLSVTEMVQDEDQEEMNLYCEALDHRVAWTKLEKGDCITLISGIVTHKDLRRQKSRSRVGSKDLRKTEHLRCEGDNP